MTYVAFMEAAKAEAGERLVALWDPKEIALEVAVLDCVVEYVGKSLDLPKDALMALEEAKVIRRLPDDMFFDARDELTDLLHGDGASLL
jgi:hypothetical protein